MPFRRVRTILVEVYLIFFFKVHFGYKFKLSLGIYLLFMTMFAVSKHFHWEISSLNSPRASSEVITQSKMILDTVKLIEAEWPIYVSIN